MNSKEIFDAQQWFTPEEKIILQYLEDAKKRRLDIGVDQKPFDVSSLLIFSKCRLSNLNFHYYLQCNNRLYYVQTFALTNSESKIIKIGMDPNSFFDVNIRIVDKKTGAYIALSLENMAQLILDVKTLLQATDESERVSGLFASGCTISKCQNDIYRIDQFYGLASRRFILIHKDTLSQLLRLENNFLYLAPTYTYMAECYIKLLRQYVRETRELIDKNDPNVQDNKLYVLQRALKTYGVHKVFLCDTIANFEKLFVSLL